MLLLGDAARSVSGLEGSLGRKIIMTMTMRSGAGLLTQLVKVRGLHAIQESLLLGLSLARVVACVKIVVWVRCRAGRTWTGKANPLGRPARSPAVGTYRAQQVGGPALLIRRWSRCAAPAHQQERVCRGPALGLNCHWPISSSSSLGSRFQRSKLISLRGSQPTHAMTNPTVQLLLIGCPLT